MPTHAHGFALFSFKPMVMTVMTDVADAETANKLAGLQIDLLRKHRSGNLPLNQLEQFLNLSREQREELLAVVRERVEKKSSVVSGINRNQSPQEALDATGRKQYTDQLIVDAMPRGEGENVKLKFFELDYEPTPRELAAEYKCRELKPDPRALAKHMEDNPAFADDRPVICQWDPGENGAASYAGFGRWFGGRSVGVSRRDGRWGRRFRFAGVCK